MKRLDFRMILGVGLILLGGSMLLERLGVIRGASSLFWGLAFLAGAAYFLLIFFDSPQTKWWALFPAGALAGMGGSSLLPEAFSGWGGGIFLGTLGLAFIAVYITNRVNWWAIIPGGVLFTLATVSVVTDFEAFNAVSSGGLFFIGLGLTFLLVALLPNPLGKMQWAYIPAIVLLLMGGVLSSSATEGLVNYIWPAGLIIGGLLIIFGFFTNRN